MPKTKSKQAEQESGETEVPDEEPRQVARISDLTRHTENAMGHPDRNVEMIRQSLEEVGAARSIVIDEDGMILAGNGVIQAAVQLGLVNVQTVDTDGQTIIAVRRTGLTPEEKKRLAYFDNRTGQLGEWDLDQVLADMDAGVNLAGIWDEQELAKLLNLEDDTPEPEEPIDKAAELMAKWGTAPGQLWAVASKNLPGRAHRVACGDATSADDVERLMGGELAEVAITDPPYGVNYQAEGYTDIVGDDLAGDDLVKLLVGALLQVIRRTTDAAPFYIWHSTATEAEFQWALKSTGLAKAQTIIWVKPALIIGHQHYQNQYEPCIYAHKDGETPNYYGDRSQSNVWLLGATQWDLKALYLGKGVLVSDGQGKQIWVQSEPPRGRKLRRLRLAAGERALLYQDDPESDVWYIERDPKRMHPTQKPIELMRRALLNSSRSGDVAVDTFMGAGSLIVAAEATSRLGYGMDLEPKYLACTLERLAQMGLKPQMLE